MADVNPLSHRLYIAELERVALAQPRQRTWREAAACLVVAARRLLESMVAREA